MVQNIIEANDEITAVFRLLECRQLKRAKRILRQPIKKGERLRQQAGMTVALYGAKFQRVPVRFKVGIGRAQIRAVWIDGIFKRLRAQALRFWGEDVRPHVAFTGEQIGPRQPAGGAAPHAAQQGQGNAILLWNDFIFAQATTENAQTAPLVGQGNEILEGTGLHRSCVVPGQHQAV